MSLALNELGAVIPDVVEVTAGGETFKLKRFSLGQLKYATAHAALITLLFNAMQDGKASPFEIITNGGDSVVELLAIATKKPVEWCEELGPDEGAELLLAVAEVNLSFFVNALSPLLKGWTERATRLAAAIPNKTAA